MMLNNVDTIFLSLMRKNLCKDVIYVILNYFCIGLNNDNIHEAVRDYEYYEYSSILMYGKIEYWKTDKITNMSNLFRYLTLNVYINSWNVSNVTNMNSMFYECCNFNQPLDEWNVSNVENMSFMFYNADSFNQPLNTWNVSKVNNMSNMFCYATEFDQCLNNWNVSNVRTMNNMFFGAISIKKNTNWKINKNTNVNDMYSNTCLDPLYYND